MKQRLILWICFTVIFLLISCNRGQEDCEQDQFDFGFFSSGYEDLVPLFAVQDSSLQIDLLLDSLAEAGLWEAYTKHWAERHILHKELALSDSMLINCKELLHEKYPDSLCSHFSWLYHCLGLLKDHTNPLYASQSRRSAEYVMQLSVTQQDSVEAFQYLANTNLNSFFLDQSREDLYEMLQLSHRMECSYPDSFLVKVDDYVFRCLAHIYSQYPFVDSALKYFELTKTRRPEKYAINKAVLWQQAGTKMRIGINYDPSLLRSAAADSIDAIADTYIPILDSKYAHDSAYARENRNHLNSSKVLAALLRDDPERAMELAETLREDMFSNLSWIYIYTYALAANGRTREAIQLIKMTEDALFGQGIYNRSADYMLEETPTYLLSSLGSFLFSHADAHRYAHIHTKSIAELDTAASLFEKSNKVIDHLIIRSLGKDRPNGILTSIDTYGMAEVGCYIYNFKNPTRAFGIIDKAKIGAVTRAYQDFLVSPAEKEVMSENIKDYISMGDMALLRETDYREVQKALPPNTSMINYLMGNEQAYVAVLHNTGEPKLIMIENPDSLRIWAYACKKRMSSEPGYGNQFLDPWLDLSHRLYKALIEPLDIPEGNQLIIIPDGALLKLSFEALLTEEEALSHVMDRIPELSFLIKKHPIRYAYSAQSWLMQKEQMARLKSQPEMNKTYWGVSGATAACGENVDLNYENSCLEWAEQLWGNEAETLHGNRATKEQCIKIMNSENFSSKIMQFYVHGGWDSIYLRRPFFELSCIDPESPKKQNLYSSDIMNANLDMNVKLLILSACGSGEPRFHGSEGLSDMGRCFAVASGCPALYSGLWSLEDTSTTPLLKTALSYMHDQNTSFADALHQAKLDYLDRVKGVGAFPYYWAGIGMYGADGKLMN